MCYNSALAQIKSMLQNLLVILTDAELAFDML